MSVIDDRMSTFREIVSCAHDIPFTEYDANTFEPLFSNASHNTAIYFFLPLDTDLQQHYSPEFLQNRHGEKAVPVINSNSLGMVWIAAVEMDGASPKKVHTMGPVFLDDYSISDIECRLRDYRLSAETLEGFLDFVKSLPIVSTIRFYEYALMLHWCLTGERITISELRFFEPDNTVQVQSTNAAEDGVYQRHATYNAEQRMLQCVRDGNLNYRKEMDRLASFGSIGKLTESGSTLRELKNHVLIYTALCCRAAMEGGLDQEIAYTISDRYIRSIERATAIGALAEISRTMVADYVIRVYRLKTEDGVSPQIRTICQFIELNIQMNHDIHDLALKVGYTDYYFSKKFKREIGMTVKDYILEQKIKYAKSMLRDPKTAIADVSEYLGFNSQSYFGEQFRRITGMSPSEYRISLKE